MKTAEDEPEYFQFYHKSKEAIAFLMGEQKGIAVAALYHPELGDVDIVWGNAGNKRQHGFGLAKIIEYHPEVLDKMQMILERMNKMRFKGDKGYDLRYKNFKATVRPMYNDKERPWLMTMFEIL